ncbi:DUF1540 domain-containing protein [Clostridium thermarum]|uniref:DUF1540 domain-containing protein n=1 Tax=Clostridium thermarum TaxID=1716543 RepID=UPI0015D66E71|nr:DUF1540 domain-containing protein [Clostridium thermarum]
MHNGHNDSIGCVVNECKFHAGNVDYCTLQQIKIVKHENRADTMQCTDCGSFERA